MTIDPSQPGRGHCDGLATVLTWLATAPNMTSDRTTVTVEAIVVAENTVDVSMSTDSAHIRLCEGHP